MMSWYRKKECKYKGNRCNCAGFYGFF